MYNSVVNLHNVESQAFPYMIMIHTERESMLLSGHRSDAQRPGHSPDQHEAEHPTRTP